jgi:hypothetical protein
VLPLPFGTLRNSKFLYQCVIVYIIEGLSNTKAHFLGLPKLFDSFEVDGFNYQIISVDDDKGTYYYQILRSNFRMLFISYGTDTASDCGHS